MIIYNTQRNQNIFGFQDKSGNHVEIGGNQARTAKHTTANSQKCPKKKLTAQNIAFLKSLGLKVRHRI